MILLFFFVLSTTIQIIIFALLSQYRLFADDTFVGEKLFKLNSLCFMVNTVKPYHLFSDLSYKNSYELKLLKEEVSLKNHVIFVLSVTS